MQRMTHVTNYFRSVKPATRSFMPSRSITNTLKLQIMKVQCPLAPLLILHGDRNGIPWKAKLDILKFVHCLFYNYDGT